jgi:hypothetical protein
MRALSTIQPWAHVILHEGKNVENRPRTTHLRGTIAIHSSIKIDQEGFARLKRDYGITLDANAVHYGCIVGFADIVDVITDKTVTRRTKKWFGGEFGYVLTNVLALAKPVPIKGALGFWRLKGAALRQCLDQVPSSRLKLFKVFQKPEKLRLSH